MGESKVVPGMSWIEYHCCFRWISMNKYVEIIVNDSQLCNCVTDLQNNTRKSINSVRELRWNNGLSHMVHKSVVPRVLILICHANISPLAEFCCFDIDEIKRAKFIGQSLFRHSDYRQQVVLPIVWQAGRLFIACLEWNPTICRIVKLTRPAIQIGSSMKGLDSLPVGLAIMKCQLLTPQLNCCRLHWLASCAINPTRNRLATTCSSCTSKLYVNSNSVLSNSSEFVVDLAV